MKIVSFIDEARAVEKILKHLELWTTQNSGKPPPEDNGKIEVEYYPCDDGWGQYEEPSIWL